MKRIVALIPFLLVATAAWAADNPIGCTGNSCKILVQPRDSGGTKVTAADFAGTGAGTFGPSAGGVTHSIRGTVGVSSDGSSTSPSGFDLKIRSGTSKFGIHTTGASGVPTIELGNGASGSSLIDSTGNVPLRIATNSIDRVVINGDGKTLFTVPTASSTNVRTSLSDGQIMFANNNDSSVSPAISGRAVSGRNGLVLTSFVDPANNAPDQQYQVASSTASALSTGGLTNKAFAWYADGSEIMSMSRAGSVTMPAQPAADATRTGGDQTCVTGAVDASCTAIMNTQSFDQGGDNYSTSTGIYTCPTTGNYLVAANLVYIYTTNPSSLPAVLMNLLRNNAGTDHTSVCGEGSTAGTSRNTCGGTWIVSCTAGQNLRIDLSTNVGGGSRTLLIRQTASTVAFAKLN